MGDIVLVISGPTLNHDLLRLLMKMPEPKWIMAEFDEKPQQEALRGGTLSHHDSFELFPRPVVEQIKNMVRNPPPVHHSLGPAQRRRFPIPR